MEPDWLTITKVTHAQRRKDEGLRTWLQDVTYVQYEAEDEPGKRFMAVFEGHLPENDELLRKTKNRYLVKATPYNPRKENRL